MSKLRSNKENLNHVTYYLKMTEKADQPADLALTFSEETGIVTATVTPADKGASITPHHILQSLTDKGWDSFQVDNSQIQNIVQAARDNKELSATLAVRIDEGCHVEISDDKMTATLTITAAAGGRTLIAEDVVSALKEHEVLYDTSILTTQWEAARSEPLVVATGVEPINGKNAVFKQLFPDHTVKPKLRDDGSVNMLELQTFVMVNPGDIVMVKQPATPGKPGKDVLGNELQPVAGVDPGFTIRDESVEVNPDNEHELRATIKGHPISFANGAKIDPVLSFDNIDVSTGNIRFDGSITIKGDIQDGFEVSVTGDIIVKGNIYGAKVRAGKNITVQGGIVGRREEHDEASASESASFHNHLIADGNIEAKFVNFSLLFAEGSVHVKDYIYHSSVSAKHSIVIGENNGKGLLVGGISTASYLIEANTFGNDTNTRTTLNVGSSRELMEKYRVLTEKLASRKKESIELIKILKKIRAMATKKLGEVTLNKARRILTTLQHLSETKAQLKYDIDATEQNLTQSRAAEIRCNKSAHANLHIAINDNTHSTNKDYETKGRFCVKKRQVCFVADEKKKD